MLRRTARKIRRLKGVVAGMCPAYSDSPDPRLPDALLQFGSLSDRLSVEILRALCPFEQVQPKLTKGVFAYPRKNLQLLRFSEAGRIIEQTRL